MREKKRKEGGEKKYGRTRQRNEYEGKKWDEERGQLANSKPALFVCFATMNQTVRSHFLSRTENEA